jgi:hypothetical protein
MLVKFAVDEDALFSGAADAVSQRAAHRRLLNAWRHVGVLVIDAPEGQCSSFLTAVQRLPQALRTMWQQALMRQRRIQSNVPQVRLSIVNNGEELSPLASIIELACLEETRACCFGVPADEESINLPDSGIELCRFDLADQSQAFRRAVDLASADIPEGTRVGELWAQRFARLASLCHGDVVVVDRYCATSHMQRRDGYSGLRRLLVELDNVVKACTVYVYSSIVEYAEDEIVDSVSSLAKNLGTGIRSVVLRLVADGDFSRTSHYRYLRFGDDVYDIDVGLDVFAGERTFRTCIFRLRQRSDVIAADEKILKAFCSEYQLACKR